MQVARLLSAAAQFPNRGQAYVPAQQSNSLAELEQPILIHHAFLKGYQQATSQPTLSTRPLLDLEKAIDKTAESYLLTQTALVVHQS